MKKYLIKGGQFIKKHILLYNMIFLFPFFLLSLITWDEKPLYTLIFAFCILWIDLPWIVSSIRRIWPYVKIMCYFLSQFIQCTLTITILLPTALCLGTFGLGFIIPFALLFHWNITWGLYFAAYMFTIMIFSFAYISLNNTKYEMACEEYYAEHGKYPKGYISRNKNLFNNALLWFLIGHYIGHSDLD